MDYVLEPRKKVPVFVEADVIVVGGGPAGIGAALASARNGAKTMVIEKFGALGGMQTQHEQYLLPARPGHTGRRDYRYGKPAQGRRGLLGQV